MEASAIREVAREVKCGIGDAVSDIAYGAVQFPDKDTKVKFADARKKGVIDIAGWYADELYNDIDTLCDLTGDKIYDAAEGKSIIERFSNMVLIAEAMIDQGHEALKDALKKHIKNWKQTVKRIKG